MAVTETIKPGIVAEPGQTFGGSWTELKLEKVHRYLDAYAQALKNKSFGKIYIDAFAGTGYREMVADGESTPVLWEEAEAEATRIFAGSAKLSLQIVPPFDRYVFIEKNAKRLAELGELKNEHPDLADRIALREDDANHAIPEICRQIDWRRNRAVMFLDPYGMSVDWSTMEAIAQTKAIDVWILFPVGIGVNRLLPDQPTDISASWRARLDRAFGATDWQRNFYKPNGQSFLFPQENGGLVKVSDPIQAITNYYQARLDSIFPKVAPYPRFLCNDKRKSPMFILTFAMASDNPKAHKAGMNIARYILERQF